ncbi:hypothetical protein F3Y22_tig00007902pilonHSYRG00027 [Hibiscus syriacus]|uniref:Uncharacterized protein n=1 Tax=Hibiscus syriacus TaxID=106335 RepID=A0A6A3CB64_HIBSY|nr:hypothetical protein F3Y22_tig00007902pilonHSYRG00027 [Hibiscus syriacus]
MTNQQLKDRGNQMIDETAQAIDRANKVVQDTVDVGTETAAALKAQGAYSTPVLPPIKSTIPLDPIRQLNECLLLKNMFDPVTEEPDFDLDIKVDVEEECNKYGRVKHIFFLLGLPYNHPMDMWSVGFCLYELYIVKVLFPSLTNNDMLCLHMELKSPFQKKMLRKVGRMAGKFAKPRSDLFQIKDGAKYQQILELHLP